MMDLQIGCKKAQLVIKINSNKPWQIIDPRNCDYITWVEYICSVNKTILLILLVFEVNILYK